MKYTSAQSLTSALSVLKSLDSDSLDEEYYELMTAAKDILGELNPAMADFYYQYGSYLLGKIEKNGELFGDFKAKQQPEQLPSNTKSEPAGTHMQHYYQDESSEQAEVNNTKGHENQEGIQQLQGAVMIKSEFKGVQLRPDEEAENEEQIADAQQQDDDEICFLNLESALNIYKKIVQDIDVQEFDPSPQKREKAVKNVAKTRIRLGDFYFVKQAFTDAVSEYEEAMKLMQTLSDASTSRQLAETYYLVANSHLYDGKKGCQQSAIKALLQGINILINHLVSRAEVKNAEEYPRPTMEKLKVERLPFLPKINDSQYVRQLKQIISQLMDKLEDTEIQMRESEQVNKVIEQQKKSSQAQTSFSFDAPTQPQTNTINLGTFGNATSGGVGGVTIIRRKLPPSSEPANANSQAVSHSTQRQKPLGEESKDKAPQTGL